MRDTKSILLGMLSVGLVATWGFYFYEKTHIASKIASVAKDPHGAEKIKDSLQRIYNGTISFMDYQLDSTRNNADSLKHTLDTKLAEINLLKTEIDSILQLKQASPAEMDLAKMRITELQKKVNDLTNQKERMAAEKQHLMGMLADLSGQTEGIRDDIIRLNDENRALTEKVSQSSIFTVSDLRIINNGTNADGSQIAVSFDVKNKAANNNAELFLVVIQPDGKVLRNDVWETSYIDTKKGKKVYTSRLRFDYQRGENKHLSYTFPSDDYPRGNYTLQVYQNGLLIGQSVSGV